MIHDCYYQPKIHYPGFKGFCDLNCIRLILEANKVQYPHLYLNASMDFKLDLNSSINECNFELLQLTKSRSVIPEYVNKVKKHYYTEDVNPIDIYNLNIKKVEDSPIAVGVDNYYLPYMKEDHYLKEHAWHTIIICGVEKANDLLYVIDWADPWFYLGTIQKEDFILARSSPNTFCGDIFSGLPIENYWIEIDKNDWNKSPSELLAIILELSLNQYFFPVNNQICGINALYNDLYNIKDLEINKELFTNLHRKLYIALLRHNLFRQYLENSNQYLNINEINSIINDIYKTNDKWQIILMLILKISMSGQKNIFSKLFDNINKVINDEKHLGEKIFKIYNELTL